MANELLRTLPAGSIQIFSIIQKAGPIAKSDLCKLTDKKFPTINHFIEPLMQAKLVIECGVGDSTGGRKPMLYAVAPQAHYLLGVSVSPTRCEAAVLNFRMEVLKFETIRAGAENLAETVAASLRNQLEQLGIPETQVYGIGVSVSAAGKELYAPLAGQLGNLLNMPFAAGECTSASALLEYFYGCGRGLSRMLYLHCGEQIRSTVIVDGKPVGCSTCGEDAVGHMIINFDGDECGCGNFGCVDCYATVPAMLEKAASELKKGRPSALSERAGRLTFLDVCCAAEQGDSLACDALLSSASALGVALTNALRLYSPQLVVIEGPLAQESQLYFDAAIQIVQKKLFHAACLPSFRRSGSFHNPTLSGAGAIMVEALLREAELTPA